jgi:hypothetical protein
MVFARFYTKCLAVIRAVRGGQVLLLAQKVLDDHPSQLNLRAESNNVELPVNFSNPSRHFALSLAPFSPGRPLSCNRD